MFTLLLIISISTAYNIGLKKAQKKQEYSVEDIFSKIDPISTDPYTKMNQMSLRMEQLFDEVWDDPFSTYSFDFPSAPFPMTITNLGNFQRVAFDYYTQDNEIVIKAQLPVEEEAQVDVSITEQGVTIKSVKEYKTGKSTMEGEVEEYRNQQFYRYLALPENADTTKVRQTFKDGTLEIRIPIKGIEETG